MQPSQQRHGRRAGALALAFLGALALVDAAPLVAQRPAQRPWRHWSIGVDYGLARPSGWVRVRENDITGTRLDLARDLNLEAVPTVAVRLGFPVGGSGTLQLRVAGTTLSGQARLPGDVHFNGATLQGGTTLETRTHWTDFMRVTLLYRTPLYGRPDGPRLYGMAGLDATLLNFRLRGTLSPSSVGSETKEDFVTQELPVPSVGAEAQLPLGRGLRLDFDLRAGALPWVASLRYEGGMVRLRQRQLDAGLRMAYEISRRVALGGGYRFSTFAQDEQSREDGNEFRLTRNGLELRMTWRP